MGRLAETGDVDMGADLPADQGMVGIDMMAFEAEG
jgi:hypothetical protein